MTRRSRGWAGAIWGALLCGAALAADGTPEGSGCQTQGFDGVTAPAMPAGWFAVNNEGPPTFWETSTTTPLTLPNAAFVPSPPVVSDRRLHSVTYAIPAGSAQVVFSHKFDLEEPFDGGVLEISIGGGAFADILDQGGSFAGGSYRRRISVNFQNPIGGRLAWTGDSGGYITTVANLPASAAGQDVVLRFRMASDTSNADNGWWVDAVYLSPPCTAPTSLLLDVHSPPDTPSATGLNGIWEPGEAVVVEPELYNPGAGSVIVSGLATNVSGPGGDIYHALDSLADYGTVGAGVVSDCFNATGNCYRLLLEVPAARPVVHWDALFQEMLSNGGTNVWTLHVGDSFTDVPSDNIFYPFIENILHNAITAGCGNGTAYCPGDETLRQQMAVFVLKALEGPTYAPPACTGTFVDVPCPGTFAPWIEELFDRGVVAGCGPGPAYCPTNPVLRQQMAVFLLRTLLGSGYTPPACTGVFPDVDCDTNPFGAWIEDLVNRGIAAGCGGGNFCPTNVTNRGQMAPFLVKSFGLKLYGP